MTSVDDSGYQGQQLVDSVEERRIFARSPESPAIKMQLTPLGQRPKVLKKNAKHSTVMEVKEDEANPQHTASHDESGNTGTRTNDELSSVKELEGLKHHKYTNEEEMYEEMRM